MHPYHLLRMVAGNHAVLEQLNKVQLQMKAYKEEIVVLKKLARDNLMYGGAKGAEGGNEEKESQPRVENPDQVLNELIELKKDNADLTEEVNSAKKENQTLRARVEELQKDIENERIKGDRIRLSKELFRSKLEEMQQKYGKEVVAIPDAEEHSQPPHASKPSKPLPVPPVPQRPPKPSPEPSTTPEPSGEQVETKETRLSKKAELKEAEFFRYLLSSLLMVLNYYYIVLEVRARMSSIGLSFMRPCTNRMFSYLTASTTSAKRSSPIPIEDSSPTCSRPSPNRYIGLLYGTTSI